jgi:hypothetical protein
MNLTQKSFFEDFMLSYGETRDFGFLVVVAYSLVWKASSVYGLCSPYIYKTIYRSQSVPS